MPCPCVEFKGYERCGNSACYEAGRLEGMGCSKLPADHLAKELKERFDSGKSSFAACLEEYRRRAVVKMP